MSDFDIAVRGRKSPRWRILFSKSSIKHHYFEVMSNMQGVTTFKRKYSSWKKGKTKRAKAASASVAKIARQVVNSSGQSAYVTTYLSHVDPDITNYIYFNVGGMYENFSELAHVSRGLFLDLSNCPNTSTTPALNSGTAVNALLNAQGVCSALFPASQTASAIYPLKQHSSAVMDGNKYFQHSIWWDLSFRNVDTTGPFRVKMYIVRAKAKRENLIEFFQGMGAPVLPGWVEVLQKKEFILSAAATGSYPRDHSMVANTSGRIAVNKTISTTEQEYSGDLLRPPNSNPTIEGHIHCLITWNRMVSIPEALTPDTQPLQINGYFRTRLSDSH